ncbi:MAG: hypothetical protein U0414_00490 [Polyangiaceae bacterium]
MRRIKDTDLLEHHRFDIERVFEAIEEAVEPEERAALFEGLAATLAAGAAPAERADTGSSLGAAPTIAAAAAAEERPS